jgi:alkaline phosphatase
MNVWLDRNVYKSNLDKTVGPLGETGARDQPGLKEMTLKAIDILSARSKKTGSGFFMMSEAASIDKQVRAAGTSNRLGKWPTGAQMHTLDYDRALGDLLELDDTVRATLKKLKDLGELDETLIVVTADHGCLGRSRY